MHSRHLHTAEFHIHHPIDPEDIHELASMMDDVLDGLEEAAHCLVAYKVEPIPEP